MSRIGNALLKESSVRKLKAVPESSELGISPDYQADKKNHLSRIIMIVAGVAAGIAAARADNRARKAAKRSRS